MKEKTANHLKAPNAAAFVGQMRQVFGGDVKVLYVKEGGFQIGERQPEGASCLYDGDGQKLVEKYAPKKQKKAA